MLEVFTRENYGNLVKSRYVFRSSTMAVLEQEELIRKMGSSNTTVTEADILAVLNVMKSVVLEYTKQGYKVRTPLGLFYASASGSTDDILADFDPRSGSTDHDIKLHFRPATDVVQDVRENTTVKRNGGSPKTAMHISLVKNAAGTDDAAVRPGDMILIAGDFLKFDPAGSEEGVFLTDGNNSYRLSYYTRNTIGMIEARIDTDIPAGDYTLTVKTMPASVTTEASWKKPVTITA